MEYLADGADLCPLIRLFDFAPQEISKLHRVVDQLAAGSITEFDLSHLPNLQSIGGMRFVFRLSKRDEAIKETSPLKFELRYSADGWEDIALRIEAFERPTNGYQWLLDVPTDINLLLSPDGSW